MAKSQVQFTKDNEYYTPKDIECLKNQILAGTKLTGKNSKPIHYYLS